MRFFKMLAGSFLLCFGAGLAGGEVQALKAEIKLAQLIVGNNEDFSVTTTIRNTGTAEETLVVWDCSYPAQWRPDSPIIKDQVIACRQNVPGTIKLRPGETYTRPVLVHVELINPERRQSVTFRLGYGTWAYYGTIEPAPKSPAIWSNAVTVLVVPRIVQDASNAVQSTDERTMKLRVPGGLSPTRQ